MAPPSLKNLLPDEGSISRRVEGISRRLATVVNTWRAPRAASSADPRGSVRDVCCGCPWLTLSVCCRQSASRVNLRRGCAPLSSRSGAGGTPDLRDARQACGCRAGDRPVKAGDWAAGRCERGAGPGRPTRTTTTELVYRHELRPVITTGTGVMDRILNLGSW